MFSALLQAQIIIRRSISRSTVLYRPMIYPIEKRTFLSSRQLSKNGQFRLQRAEESMDPKEILKKIETIEKNNKPFKEVKKPMWQKVKDEATHYWHGMKLLGLDIKISLNL